MDIQSRVLKYMLHIFTSRECKATVKAMVSELSMRMELNFWIFIYFLCLYRLERLRWDCVVAQVAIGSSELFVLADVICPKIACAGLIV